MRTLRRVVAALGGMVMVAALTAPVATAGLLVTAVDDTYTAVHDRLLSVNAAAGVLDNDSGLGLSAVRLTNPVHGTLTFSGNGSFTYRPAAGYVGPDSFTYEARVLNLLGIVIGSDTAIVSLTVTNTAPVAHPDSYTATTGVMKVVAAPGVLANDTDADGDSLSVKLVDGGGNGSFDLESDGGFTYKSGGSFVGTFTFTYQAWDGVAWSGTTTASIEVKPPTPVPTPTPNPTPVPTPTPTSTPTPTPRPIPTMPPLPTIGPLPSIIILPTPTPRPDPSASPTPAPTASADPDPTPSPEPTLNGRPSPSASATPPPSVGGGTVGGGGPGAGPAGPDGATGPTAGGGSATGSDGSGGRSLEIGGSGGDSIVSLLDAGFVGLDELDWAVPALTLTVPALLLIVAVLAQVSAGALWLPVIRRWLGGFGIGRRRRSNDRSGVANA